MLVFHWQEARADGSAHSAVVRLPSRLDRAEAEARRVPARDSPSATEAPSGLGRGSNRNLREVLVDRLGDRATFDFSEVRRQGGHGCVRSYGGRFERPFDEFGRRQSSRNESKIAFDLFAAETVDLVARQAIRLHVGKADFERGVESWRSQRCLRHAIRARANTVVTEADRARRSTLACKPSRPVSRGYAGLATSALYHSRSRSRRGTEGSGAAFFVRWCFLALAEAVLGFL
jgi:hypothetical protein